MANLIPPDAKQELKIQYWMRVVSVWCFLGAIALGLVSIAHVPTLVLINSQYKSYADRYQNAQEQADEFAAAEVEVQGANALAALLSSDAASTSAQSLVELLDTIGGNAISIRTMRFDMTATGLESLTVQGTAATRLALATFSQELESHPYFAEAEVPISNLAKDKDIAFNIKIIPADM